MEREILKVQGYSQEDLDKFVKEEVGEGQLDFNRLLGRMERVYRVSGSVLGPAIHRVCDIKDNRILGIKTPPPEEPSEE